MTLGFQDQNFDFYYENIVIKKSAEESGSTTDSKLNF